MKNLANNIAITGISCVFPGALTIDEFAANIMAGHEAIIDVPDHRWIIPPDQMVSKIYQPDTVCSKRAGLVRGFDLDPEGFLLDRDIIHSLDPLHQMVLHAGRDALSACFHTPETRMRTGLILAAISLPTQASSELSHKIIMEKASNISRADLIAPGMVSVPASILARAMGLSGGSFTLDAACASSLYAIKLACEQLNLGKADMIIAGGVSRPDSLYTQVGFTQLKALSPTGRCAPFDASADGLVVGEGAGIIVLKRLDDAIAAGDKIWGVIKGAGWSNDIGGNLVAPASDGQIRAMAAAYKNAGWLPRDIQHLECHGSATPVGDNIELNSMKTLWQDTGCANAPCAIGSIKSMTGHLLTAAGAAGLIKTLVAMEQKQLPPSLHFTSPPSQSPLYTTGFRVQTKPAPWEAIVRRAGVSAFGFGGINAHVLVEEFKPNAPKQFFQPKAVQKNKVSKNTPMPIAIVGMETIIATADNLEAFKEQVLGGRTTPPEKPESRWRIKPSKENNLPAIKGFWINQVTTFPGEFHLPPNQVPDLLPQHLIMLKAATNAMKDASLSPRPLKDEPSRTRFGAAIGIEFDYGAADFHLRWKHNDQDEHVKDLLSPPLTANRTLGALGGIVASRIAREFKLGGPCFTVSAQAASGIKAIEIGINSLRSGEADLFLCGAVDMAGDVRQTLLNHGITPFTHEDETRSFDKNATGTLPSEGACALILKPLDQARRDKDRIYAIIRETTGANLGSSPEEMADGYERSIKSCLAHANIPASSMGLYEAHAGANPMEDAMELNTLQRMGFTCAVGSTKATCGDTGAVAGMLSVIKASLALFHHIIPPVPGFIEPLEQISRKTAIHIPKHPTFWVKNSNQEPRSALVATMTRDKSVAHLVLEGVDSLPDDPCSWQIEQERLDPLGVQGLTLFVIRGDSKSALVSEIQRLDVLMSQIIQDESSINLSCNKIGNAWFRQSKPSTRPSNSPSTKPSGGKSTAPVLSILAKSVDTLKRLIPKAIQAVQTDKECAINEFEGIAYTLNPMGPKGRTAFIYPGSGNHFPGMGRALGTLFPEILDAMEQKAPLDRQVLPALYYPHRMSWEPGWEKETAAKINAHAHNMIYGQVFFGNLMTQVAKSFGLTPQAGIGHSLGETASLFSLGVWNDPREMLSRMEQSDLFTNKLAGKFLAAKKSWHLAENETPEWRVAAVNRSADEVETELCNHEHLYLLIKNTPHETVIGGSKDSVNAFIKQMGCGAMFLDGVVTVHCPIVESCANDYLNLHKFACNRPLGIDFYSCSKAQSYLPSTDATAQSILDQAIKGFDYVKLINQAWEDGIRVFVEMGPGSSCTRAVDQILEKKEHLVMSLSSTKGDDFQVMVKCLATLAAHKVKLDLSRLYVQREKNQKIPVSQTLTIPTVRRIIDPFAVQSNSVQNQTSKQDPIKKPILPTSLDSKSVNKKSVDDQSIAPQQSKPETPSEVKAFSLLDSARLTTRAHETFLTLTQMNMKAYEAQFAALTQVARVSAQGMELSMEQNLALPQHDPEHETVPQRPPQDPETFEPEPMPVPLFDRNMCLEFARGLAGNVLGKEFDIIDDYPVRVRLPDEPLMLVDRIMEIEGKMLSMGQGKIVTQHDVLDNAWYLDGGKAPVSITIEAGQADLFLCSWLGIDHQVKGKRRYRLLDAKVTFHRELPQPGETIEYHIEINRFLKQGEIHLFFFHYRGYINGELLISMRDGCAGFFTPEEVENSGGILLTPQDRTRTKGKKTFIPPAPMANEQYEAPMINALRTGDLEGCFGPLFKGLILGKNMRLPGGRMHLLDRVIELDPNGGKFGLGRIVAEADIRPDKWFLTCHFIDDMVMPGTLMYECCAHTLRIFTQRMGWISKRDDVHYDIIECMESDLKCRGPVTVHTKKARYEIEIKEMGYGPEPYVIAHAHMFSDNHRIVLYKNMGLKIAGLSCPEIEKIWA